MCSQSDSARLWFNVFSACFEVFCSRFLHPALLVLDMLEVLHQCGSTQLLLLAKWLQTTTNYQCLLNSFFYIILKSNILVISLFLSDHSNLITFHIPIGVAWFQIEMPPAPVAGTSKITGKHFLKVDDFRQFFTGIWWGEIKDIYKILKYCNHYFCHW